MYTYGDERGNAVTLTLLGLAVAILAGVVVLYFIGKSTPEPIYTPLPADEEVFETSTATEVNPRKGWRSYTDEQYNFSIEFPPGWVVTTGTSTTGDPAITLFQATETSSSTRVYTPTDVASHVSIYPLGVATEGIRNESQASKVIISVPQASAKDYVLNTERPWATLATFEQYPSSWNEAGFLFSRVLIEEEELIYMRGKTEIEQYEFDPVTGDHIERSGFIDTNIREIQVQILQSFSFTDKSGETLEAEEKKILLETPVKGEAVFSPLTIRGQVPGGWYFDDDFPIRLLTDEGEIVTESLAVSFEDWEEEEYLPFEISLVFETPNATSGKLIIGKDGVLNNESRLVVPVVFKVE